MSGEFLANQQWGLGLTRNNASRSVYYAAKCGWLDRNDSVNFYYVCVKTAARRSLGLFKVEI